MRRQRQRLAGIRGLINRRLQTRQRVAAFMVPPRKTDEENDQTTPTTAAAGHPIFQFSFESWNISRSSGVLNASVNGGGSLYFSVRPSSASSAAMICGTSSLSSMA